MIPKSHQIASPAQTELELAPRRVHPPAVQHIQPNDTSMYTSSVGQLPAELMYLLISYLSAHHLRHMRTMSRKYKAMVGDAYISNKARARLSSTSISHTTSSCCRRALRRGVWQTKSCSRSRTLALSTRETPRMRHPKVQSQHHQTRRISTRTFSSWLSVSSRLCPTHAA